MCVYATDIIGYGGRWIYQCAVLLYKNISALQICQNKTNSISAEKIYIYLYLLRKNVINRFKAKFLPINLTLASYFFQDISISNPSNLSLAPKQDQMTGR